MGTQKPYLFLALIISVSSIHFAQISEITRLPVQNASQSLKESTPVWLSENEIMIFYVNENRDTIFSTKSTNRGLNWSNPKFVQIISLLIHQSEIHLTSFKTNSGRVLVAWSVNNQSMKLIYSDDKGETWSQPVSILGAGGNPFERTSNSLNITQWESGEICLSFSNISLSASYFKLSYDDGINWSSVPLNFPSESGAQIRELSLVSLNADSLFAVYERRAANFRGLYSRTSTDNGLSWSPQRIVMNEIYHEGRPKLSKLENGNLVVIYTRDNVNVAANFGEMDVYYIISSDNGSSWSSENRFTKYIGEDLFINISSNQNKTFISFSTERYSVIVPIESPFQIAYGILEESAELFTPPKVYNAYTPLEFINFEDNTFVFRATVIDDEEVQQVTAVMEDSIYIGEMFDDGLHFDSLANDKIFGNVFPIVQKRYFNGYYINVNKLELPINNKGILADLNLTYGQLGTIIAEDLNNNQSLSEREISLGNLGSQGKYEEGSFLFSAGFFLSGYSNNVMFSNAVSSASLVEDYLPGVINSNPEDPLNVIYVVNINDPVFGSSWQRWKDAVILGAEFYDGDQDGNYNPVDKNINGTWDLTEDMPLLIGNEIAWCVYNDAVPINQRRWNTIEPQGIEIRQTIFASDNPELENVLFIRYSIMNTGTVDEIMDSVYFGVWEDADVGDATDDVVGCDTLLQSGFYYADEPDFVYGDNPPSFFTSILQGPTVKTNNPLDTAYNIYGEFIGTEQMAGAKNLGITSHVFFIGGSAELGDPNNAIEARNYLEGKTRTGTYPNPCSFFYCEVRGGVNCNEVDPHFWASGDPVNNVGWINTQQRDHRNLVSTGPFKLEKDKPQDIIIAYVMGRGTDHFNSITVARENVQRAIQEYESNFASMTYSPPPATNPVTSYVLYQNYPNPFNPNTTIRYELPQDGVVTLEVFDILGQKVKTLINEFQRADRYEVNFNANSIASGVYIYQLRVNDYITSKKMVFIR